MAESLSLTKKFDPSYLSSDSVMIDTNTNADICDPLDISPDFLLEGKNEPFPFLSNQ
jgi:hypothetical protein